MVPASMQYRLYCAKQMLEDVNLTENSWHKYEILLAPLRVTLPCSHSRGHALQAGSAAVLFQPQEPHGNIR